MRILDSDTCIEILRGNEEVKARRLESEGAVYTTWITAAELFYGAHKSKNPERNSALVEDFLAALEVLSFDLEAARIFGEIRAELERQGQRLEDADLLIAAVSLARGAVLVTGNRRHYDRVEGLVCEDWIRG